MPVPQVQIRPDLLAPPSRNDDCRTDFAHEMMVLDPLAVTRSPLGHTGRELSGVILTAGIKRGRTTRSLRSLFRFQTMIATRRRASHPRAAMLMRVALLNSSTRRRNTRSAKCLFNCSRQRSNTLTQPWRSPTRTLETSFEWTWRIFHTGRCTPYDARTCSRYHRVLEHQQHWGMSRGRTYRCRIRRLNKKFRITRWTAARRHQVSAQGMSTVASMETHARERAHTHAHTFHGRLDHHVPSLVDSHVEVPIEHAAFRED